MIKRIRLQNIKGHLDSELILHQGVNVIAGDTDSGKSTISRAFHWTVQNLRGYNPRPWKHLKPKGESIFEIETSEGDTIQRVKHTGINAYRLNGEEFKALGSEVPDQVKSALNITSVNIQPQKETHYLLDSTPGVVAKEFNKVANLQKMDTSLVSIQSKKVSVQQDITTTESTLARSKSKLDKLTFLTFANQELVKLEEAEEENTAAVQHAETVAQKTLQLRKIYKDQISDKLFKEFSELSDTKPDWSLLEEVKIEVDNCKSIELLPQQLFETFSSIEQPKEPQRLREAKTALKNLSTLELIPEQLFLDFEQLVCDLPTDYMPNVSVALVNCKNLFTSISVGDEKLKTLKEQKAEADKQLKLCVTCGKQL